MEELLAAQRAAFLRAGPPSLDQRRADLQRLRKAVLCNRRELEAAVSADFGHRSRHETASMELVTLTMGIDYLRRNLRRFMRPERRRVAATFVTGRARVEYQPLGVVGIMSPWNYPIALTLMPLATAIAAGNRAMIKPSELAPASSERLTRLLTAIFSPEQVAVVAGDAAVGAAFSALRFDHLIFTGSTTVGRAVMSAASANLTALTLELGGKSPAFVARGARLDRAARAIAFGKLANAGQTCIAPDYALVPEEDLVPFIAALDRAVARLYPEGPAGDDYTSIINDQHHARLRLLIEDAQAKGARVIELGAAPPSAGLRPHTLAPTALLDVTGDMKILQEEIFGPVLPIRGYRELDEAIALINAGPRPLALYYFGPEDGQRARVLARTTSGNVTINGALYHYAQDDLPFGGVGGSGFGAYHGIEGFRRLSHAKGIFEQGLFNPAGLLRAPFGRVAELVEKVLLR